MYDTIMFEGKSINTTENLELIFLPRPEGSDDSFKSYENFIDSQIQRIESEKLKHRLQDEIIQDVMDKVRKEFLTSTCIDTRNNRTNKEELSEMVLLREEVKEKNNIINFLSAKSSLYDNSIMTERNF